MEADNLCLLWLNADSVSGKLHMEIERVLPKSVDDNFDQHRYWRQRRQTLTKKGNNAQNIYNIQVKMENLSKGGNPTSICDMQAEPY